ncbi:MAG: hypothetical protein K2G55_07020 [Lachnospiraceae bacterium]|nr:hypothetical protein [Lachnospiraceae bacterium]MDE7200860.1 hypothetical protein [Lachnospiraceae bacterium]
MVLVTYILLAIIAKKMLRGQRGEDIICDTCGISFVNTRDRRERQEIGNVFMVEDTINRRIRVSDNTGASVQYQCIREERKLSDMQVQTAIYEYDKTGRLINEAALTREKDGRLEFAVTRYEYDRTGNCIRIPLPEGG